MAVTPPPATTPATEPLLSTPREPPPDNPVADAATHCSLAENRETVDVAPADARPGFEFETCRVCGRRHYTILAEPAPIGGGP